VETLLQRVLDRYEVDELIELLRLDTEDIYHAFESQIINLNKRGLLDV